MQLGLRGQALLGLRVLSAQQGCKVSQGLKAYRVQLVRKECLVTRVLLVQSELQERQVLMVMIALTERLVLQGLLARRELQELELQEQQAQ